MENAGRLLGITAGYELFGWGPKGVVRVEFARGRINVTPGRPIDSSGPVSLLVDPDHAIVRPLDTVAGFQVRDDGEVSVLTGALGRAGPALPGPEPEEIWVPTADSAAMVLVDLDGRPVGPTVPLPADVSAVRAVPDGAGGLLFTDDAGISFLGATGSGRVSTGTLLAVGPGGYLVSSCDRESACASEFIDRRTGQRRRVTGPLALLDSPGVISPDGRTAALTVVPTSGRDGIVLVDLATGAITPTVVPLAGAGEQMLVWSPDSRFLFVAGAAGTLYAVAATTGSTQPVQDDLPPVFRIAMRDG